MRNVTCANRECGVEYSVPDHVYNQAMLYRIERTIYCPNGHRWHYEGNTFEDMKRKLDRLQSERDDFERAFLRMEKVARYWKGIAHRRRK